MPDDAPRRRPRTRSAYTWAALVLSVLATLLVTLVWLGWHPLLDLDGRVARGLHRSALAHPGWTKTARVFTDWVWDTWTMRALTAAAVLWLWSRTERALAVQVAVAALLGALAQQLLKALVGRDRPEWERPVDSADYAAMPSGHAMTAAFTCGLLLWIVRRLHVSGTVWWSAVTVAGVSVAGVSFTRIYLGVHWLTDVVAGCLLGGAIAAWTAAAWQRGRRLERIAA